PRHRLSTQSALVEAVSPKTYHQDPRKCLVDLYVSRDRNAQLGKRRVSGERLGRQIRHVRNERNRAPRNGKLYGGRNDLVALEFSLISEPLKLIVSVPRHAVESASTSLP